MTVTAGNVLIALLWSCGAAAATWVLLLPVRRRWFSGMFLSVVLTGTAASTVALLASVREMLIPMRQWGAVMLIAIAAAVVATIAAAGAARRLTGDSRTLTRAINEVGEGRIPAQPARRLTAELEAMRGELDRTARTLAQSRDRERSLESARRELVSWMSHDLRTPLAVLQAMSEALEDGVADDPPLYYRQIAAASRRIGSMVEDLFDLSRIQSGGSTRETEQIALDDLVSDCVAALGPLARAHGVDLSGSAEPRLAALGSGTDLNRALTNLIANAIRHTPSDGHVVVDLSVHCHGTDPQRMALVTVSDECGGIPEQDLPHLFDVGFRGERARTPETDTQAHAGLGLAITQGIVEAHAGRVEVHNSSAGCTFRLLLPLAA